MCAHLCIYPLENDKEATHYLENWWIKRMSPTLKKEEEEEENAVYKHNVILFNH